MEEDKLEFLGDGPIQETPAEAPEPVEAEPQEAEAPEADTGEEEAAPPVAEPKPQDVPLTAMLDERDKRKKAEMRAKELEAQLKSMEAPQSQMPDVIEDQAGFTAALDQRVEQRFNQFKVQMSNRVATEKFGADVVAETMEFFNENPQLSHQFIAEELPMVSAVEFYQRQKFMSSVQGDPQAAIEQRAKELAEQMMAQQSKPKAPPASLSSAPSRGNDPIAPGNAFDALFGDN